MARRHLRGGGIGLTSSNSLWASIARFVDGVATILWCPLAGIASF
jgi:hypothetical protein